MKPVPGGRFVSRPQVPCVIGRIMALHPPAARRAVIRRLKNGEHPTALVADAKRITDPGHAAAAMLALAADDRLPAKKAAQMVRDSTEALRSLDRPGRLAEAWGEALAIRLKRGPETETAVERMHQVAAEAILAMPDGQWVADAIAAVAATIDAEHIPSLAKRALRLAGAEVAAFKPLLAREPGLVDLVKAEASPDVASRLLADLVVGDAVDAAWAIPDMAARREALRVIIWKLDTAEELAAIGHDAWNHDPVDAVAIHTMLAARADRLGAPADVHFDAARKALARIEGRDAARAARKLSEALERAGHEPLPAMDLVAEGPDSMAEIPIQPRTRHVLALVNGYTGAMGPTHVRAVARAAPLCVAFNLDLALLGFPVTDEEALVNVVQSETNVGEDGDYAAQLLREERLQCLPLAHGNPPFWPGTPLATTPHPAEGKSADLDAVPGPVCLVVGLGKAGLPKRMLNAVDHHHELTGQGISMETATAMGILADRLGRVPV